MGLVPKPRYSMYWSTELREAVLHRESPRYDRLFKIRSLIESIRQSCLRLGQEEYKSIDEEIIPCKGRNKLKQYIPKKPKKWGIKVNARTGMSGLLYDFCFYEGKVPRVKKPSGCLSFDINAPLKTEKELKRAFLGVFHVCTTAENNLCIIRWHNSANKKQKTLVDVSCPAIVKEYNKYMGGVDLARMLRALYRIDHRSRKWYRRIFWTLHVAVVNGWLQYKRDLKTSDAASGSQKDLMQFTLDVAEALTKVNKAYARKSRGRVSVTANTETSRRRVRRPEPTKLFYDLS
ncbi:hypothetical protein T08_3541 [Trichinella sp. T8]|nr:hypothetical protein T08_3541 [Trichinella sp. T8]